MSNNENKSITPLRKYIAIGYAVIAFIKYGVQSLVYPIGYIPKTE